MKGILYEWVRNIIYYLIMIGIVLNILPDKKYEKYVKMVFGIIIIMVLISPIFNFLDLSEKLDVSLMEKIYLQELENNETSFADIAKKQKETLFEEYENEMSQGIKDIVEKNGLWVRSVDIEICTDETDENYGKIMYMRIEATRDKTKGQSGIEKIDVGNERYDENKYESYDVVKVKKEIMEFYNLPYENINISIQR